MSALYHEGHRRWQDRFDARRLADRIEERLTKAALGAEERAFVEARDMFFLATADAAGRPTCSYKGGDPGFVRVVADDELAFPSYDGNGMFRSLGNVAVHPPVALLFIDFATPRRLRVNGTATLHHDGPLVAAFAGAQLVVRVKADLIFPNCPRYIHRMALVEHMDRVVLLDDGRIAGAGDHDSLIEGNAAYRRASNRSFLVEAVK